MSGLLGYVTGGTRFHDTGIFFAAYVNEENPMIDHLLREALNTRIVNRFLGYQGSPEAVDNQVYALWNVLQKRNFPGIVRFLIQACPAMWFSLNVFVHSMMPWSRRKLIVWMGVFCLLLCCVP